MNDYLPSPCTRNCTLNDKDICVGCFRSHREILDWNRMGYENQLKTIEKCEQRRNQQPSFFQRMKKMVNKPF
jgi:hypothetical protein